MSYVGMSGTLHDGRPGIRLMCEEDCKAGEACGCYELAIEDTVGKTTEQKAEELTTNAKEDGLSINVSAEKDGSLSFTFGDA